jgi:aromatic-L-amino-acid decarboxylase
LSTNTRASGLIGESRRLCGYTSAGAHGCISRAMDLAGFGTDALRIIEVDRHHQLDTEALRHAISADRAAGYTPFFIAATAGTVDTGAIDDLQKIADIAQQEKCWFHVDGAYGAMGMLSPDIAPRLRGIERADSIALDFHKWLQVPYDAGFVLVRDGVAHQATFSAPAAYLRRDDRGIAAGSPWPCDFGPDLSRNFKALKTWFTLQVYGTEKLGRMISNTCALARYLQQLIQATPLLELLAPVSLNIVCFRYRCKEADRINASIVIALQESGIVAPSTTMVDGRLAIRAAFVNHRTTQCEVEALVRETLRFGRIIDQQSEK